MIQHLHIVTVGP